MKYTLLIGALFTIASSCFAQDCSKNHPIFDFNNAGSPKKLRSLGSSPEFPFLRNLSTPQQVLAAMKNTHNANGKGRRELNRMLREIGFDNGVKDVRLSSIKVAYLPSGTTGNMGDGHYRTAYSRLTGSKFKAWKVTSGSGCYMYFMAKCGNAFVVNNRRRNNNTACIEVPVNITSEPKVITTGAADTKRIAEKKVFIYYHRKGRRHEYGGEYASEVPDANPSHPLLLRCVKKTEFMPQEYTVTVSGTPDEQVQVCRHKTVDVPASINVETSSEYTGNYPNTTNKVFKEVSKRVYKKSLRKMYRVRRKEEKVTDLTKVQVNG